MKQLSFSLKAIAVAVTLASSVAANAATHDIGTVAPGTTFSQYFSVPHLGVFEDFYTFSLQTEGKSDVTRTITFTIDDALTQARSGFNDLTRGLYDAATNMQIPWNSFDATAQRYFYNTLAAGNYYFRVAGEGWRDADFITPPRYNAMVNISAAVPEPQTYAMLLAGLGILGTVIQRRSRHF